MRGYQALILTLGAAGWGCSGTAAPGHPTLPVAGRVIAASDPVRAEFATPVDPNTVTTDSFRVRRDGQAVRGTIEQLSATTFAFRPATGLAAGDGYTAELTKAIRTAAGSWPIRPTTASFSVTRAQWSEPSVVSLANEAHRVQLVTTRSTKLAIWRDGDDLFASSSSTGGGTWQAPVHLTESPGTWSVTSDGIDRAAVGYLCDSGFCVRRWHDDSSRWREPETAIPESLVGDVRIAFVGERLVALFTDHYTNVFGASSGELGTWSEPTALGSGFEWIQLGEIEVVSETRAIAPQLTGGYRTNPSSWAFEYTTRSGWHRLPIVSPSRLGATSIQGSAFLWADRNGLGNGINTWFEGDSSWIEGPAYESADTGLFALGAESAFSCLAAENRAPPRSDDAPSLVSLHRVNILTGWRLLDRLATPRRLALMALLVGGEGCGMIATATRSSATDEAIALWPFTNDRLHAEPLEIPGRSPHLTRDSDGNPTVVYIEGDRILMRTYR